MHSQLTLLGAPPASCKGTVLCTPLMASVTFDTYTRVISLCLLLSEFKCLVSEVKTQLRIRVQVIDCGVDGMESLRGNERGETGKARMGESI